MAVNNVPGADLYTPTITIKTIDNKQYKFDVSNKDFTALWNACNSAPELSSTTYFKFARINQSVLQDLLLPNCCGALREIDNTFMLLTSPLFLSIILILDVVTLPLRAVSYAFYDLSNPSKKWDTTFYKILKQRSVPEEFLTRDVLRVNLTWHQKKPNAFVPVVYTKNEEMWFGQFRATTNHC